MFLLNRGELEYRIDPEFYVYKKTVESFRYSVKPLKSLLNVSPQYGANEMGVDRIDLETPRYIRITDIDEFGQLIEEDFGKTAETIEAKYFLNDNDLLFARSGNTVGKAYLHKSSKVSYPCFFAGYMIRFVLNESEVLPEFVFYFTQTRFYQSWVKGNKRTAGQPNINAEEYKSLLIPIPPIEIQQQIVEKFDKAYAEKKAKEAEAREKLASVDALVLDALGITLPEQEENTLEKRIFFTKSSDISSGRFDSPFYRPYFKKFNQAILKSLCQPLKNIAKFANEVWNQEDFFDSTFPYIEISGINTRTGEIFEVSQIEKAEAPSRARLIVREGDILVSTTRPNRGAITLLKSKHDFHIASTGFAVIRDVREVSKEYLLLLLRHQICLSQMEQRSSGGNYPAITLDELQKLQIPIPPTEVQAEIAERVEAIYAEAKLLREQGAAILKSAKAEVEAMILGKS